MNSFSDIVADIDFLANSSPETYAIADKVRNANNWIDVCIGDILSSDGRWEWDDPNQTDLPRATTTLFANQTQYNFDSSWLVVERVDVQDTGGNWSTLLPIDQSDIKGVGVGSYQTSTGVPQQFDVDGENIFLYPASNYTLAGGMKVFFQRKPVYLTTGSTTEIPAFVSIYNRIISYGAASDWALTKDQNRYAKLMANIAQMRADLKGYYGSRNKFERPRIIPTRYGNIGFGGSYE